MGAIGRQNHREKPPSGLLMQESISVNGVISTDQIPNIDRCCGFVCHPKMRVATRTGLEWPIVCDSWHYRSFLWPQTIICRQLWFRMETRVWPMTVIWSSGRLIVLGDIAELVASTITFILFGSGVW